MEINNHLKSISLSLSSVIKNIFRKGVVLACLLTRLMPLNFEKKHYMLCKLPKCSFSPFYCPLSLLFFACMAFAFRDAFRFMHFIVLFAETECCLHALFNAELCVNCQKKLATCRLSATSTWDASRLKPCEYSR
uniref:Uncharacterized protein n=1 Tax=Schistocephalus solidus TaxID=70667 RepID=A0A0X3PUH0_SCHSO